MAIIQDDFDTLVAVFEAQLTSAKANHQDSYTDAEARTKFCPLINSVACQGNSCMGWRTVTPPNTTPVKGVCGFPNF